MSTSNRRISVLAALVFGAGLLVAPPAAAEPRPNEGCPPPFTKMDRDEQLALAAAEGLPPEVVDEALAALDKNDDEVLCFLFLPAGHNIIDNRSAHRAPD